MLRKRWIFTFSVIFITIILIRINSKPATKVAYYSHLSKGTEVIAHQGGADLWPSATMTAYHNAVKLGVDVLEMDIHITKDGQLVLMHDGTVDRTTNGKGDIESMTLAEIKSLDAGYRFTLDEGKTFPYRGKGIQVPTVEEMFTTFPDYRMIIELKHSEASMAKQFCELIRKHKMQDKVVVASFEDIRLNEFRHECSEVATSGAKNEITVFVILSKLHLTGFYSPSFQSLQVPEKSGSITILTPSFIRQAKDRNLAIEPWTINDSQTMTKLIGWGVDGIMTDRPDLLMKALNR
ncbi:MAG: glycerophosphodiester phosphodiesterase [Leptonema sp. (in: Bacteria)]|nr:glycerophosphodiester phosphodiesterase [Leptonema sp. (in: bacteria)]